MSEGRHDTDAWGMLDLARFLPDPAGVCARRGCGLSPTPDFPDFPVFRSFPVFRAGIQWK